MKLYGIRIFVDDLDQAKLFYRDTLGLPVVWEMEGTAIGFDAGAQLIVEPVAPDAGPEDRALVGRFVGCSLQVDDIEETYRALSATGVLFDSLPEKQFWGGTLAHFRDPSGNVLTLLGT
ncbi:MAG: VOC family protein [Pseudomonadota bacterium]